jgi:hypothetical protein
MFMPVNSRRAHQVHPPPMHRSSCARSGGLAHRVPQEWAKNVRVPTFLYQVHRDTVTDPSDVQAMYDNIPIADKKLQRIEGHEGHDCSLGWLPGVPASSWTDTRVVRPAHGLNSAIGLRCGTESRDGVRRSPNGLTGRGN